jgi:hypothetical protein
MKLAIVWRNPDPKWHKSRWQTLERRLDRTLYIVQELVRNGDTGHWVTSFAFELVHGGRRPLLNELVGMRMEASK